jgi:hypothetical protein
MFENCGTLNQIFNEALPANPDPAQTGPGRSCATQPSIDANQFGHDSQPSGSSPSGPPAPSSSSGGSAPTPASGAAALPGAVSGGQSIASLFGQQVVGAP